MATTSIHRIVFPPALVPNWALQGSGRASPDDLGMCDYCLGGHDDKMDARGSMQSLGPGRVSPNNLGRRGAETDRHDGTQAPDGEFSVTCVTIWHSSELYVYTDIDAIDLEKDPSGTTEPADVTDANVFEVLTEHNVHPRTAVPNHCAVDPEPSNTATEQLTPVDVPDAERSQMVVINRFLSGNAGAPILSMARESHEDTAAQSVWAPFVSQCDWEVAHWAKMRGPTSSAVMDLLAIGEVRIFFNPI